MDMQILLPKIILTIILLGIIRVFLRFCDALILKPRMLRLKLRTQGIGGPPPSFLVGNILQMRKERSQLRKPPQREQGIVHNCHSSLFPYLDQWTTQYGSTFMFSFGNIQYLHIHDPDVVKEITRYTSLDLGKPRYQQKLLSPLLGRGILTSNGANWAHKRKVLGPMFTVDSVKGMMNLMVESAETLIKTWANEIESTEEGVAEIDVDEHCISFTTDVISKACFGSSYSQGKDIFLKIKGLLENMGARTLLYDLIPILSNRESRRLENEIRALILKAAQERKQATTQNNDILQTVIDGAQNMNDLGFESVDRFMVDNFKNIYLAGYETTALSAAWTLMLLATNPQWQDRVRAEVLEICGGQNPDPDMVRKMKTLTMVIQESLRLYPPAPLLDREALQDIQFGDIHVPKGIYTWISVVKLHQDPDIWGPDAYTFNPERFANGVSGSCKQPHVYMPFGIGPRVCLGQNFAMAELKILLALILSNFSFSLSPKYRHSPVQKLVLMPEYGVNLLFKKI